MLHSSLDDLFCIYSFIFLYLIAYLCLGVFSPRFASILTIASILIPPLFFLILRFKTSSSLGGVLPTGWLHSYHFALLIFSSFFFPLFCVLRLAPSLGVYSPRVASISLPLYLPNFALPSKNILPRKLFNSFTPNMIVSNSVKFDLAWCLLHLLLYSL